MSEILASYKTWFGSRAWEDDERNPYADLQPLTQKELANLEREFGVLPQSYRDLVLDVGVGRLLIASGAEAVDFTILGPTRIPQVRRDCLSWTWTCPRNLDS